MSNNKLQPKLSNVPETMLWTLHNRVSEARRDDGILHDPEAIRIYQMLDYDYQKSFGSANPSHAVRSAMFDAELHAFLDRHPNGVIVNLGEGLETQRYRVAGDEALWLAVDLPDAIAVREHFMTPDDKHLHVAVSALNRAWFDKVPAGRPVYITAQGLLMYFDEEAVKSLLQACAKRFPGALFAFDTIPRFLSQKTMNNAWNITSNYTTPKMPWGINRHQVKTTLYDWVPTLKEVTVYQWWRYPRGMGRWLFPIWLSTPIINRHVPLVIRIVFGYSIESLSIANNGVKMT